MIERHPGGNYLRCSLCMQCPAILSEIDGKQVCALCEDAPTIEGRAENIKRKLGYVNMPALLRALS